MTTSGLLIMLFLLHFPLSSSFFFFLNLFQLYCNLVNWIHIFLLNSNFSLLFFNPAFVSVLYFLSHIHMLFRFFSCLLGIIEECWSFMYSQFICVHLNDLRIEYECRSAPLFILMSLVVWHHLSVSKSLYGNV